MKNANIIAALVLAGMTAVAEYRELVLLPVMVRCWPPTGC